MTSWHGHLFEMVDHFWTNLRKFSYANWTFFELFFIVIYALEQGFLIWFTFSIENLDELSMVISLFALLVLTTFAVHKLVMESRIRILENQLNDAIQNKLSFESKAKEVTDSYRELYNLFESQHLNKPSSSLKVKKDG